MESDKEKIFEDLQDRIVRLKDFTRQLTEIQQFIKHSHSDSAFAKELKKQGLLVKHMPMNGNRLFRVFADTLYYTQSRFKEIRRELNSFVQKYEKQVSQLLGFFYPGENLIENYISQMMIGSIDFEITLVLL